MQDSVCPNCGSSSYSRAPYGEGSYCPDCDTRFWSAGHDGSGLITFTIGGYGDPFLRTEVQVFSHGSYYPKRMNRGDRLSELILLVKNSFEGETFATVCRARDELAGMVASDLAWIADVGGPFGCERPIVIAVPRSKPDCHWKESQLQFRPAIAAGVQGCPLWVRGTDEKWLLDGTDCLTRVVPTMTTHLRKTNVSNEGRSPYPGITRDTCRMERSIAGLPVILVDDIYTPDVGIDEDCVQYLLDKGASKVVLYTLGKTMRS